MGNTVIRGAYGVYYWVMPLVQYHQNTRRNAPYSYSFQSPTDTTTRSRQNWSGQSAAAPTRTSRRIPAHWERSSSPRVR